MTMTIREKVPFAEPYTKLTPHQKLIVEIYSAVVVWERWLANCKAEICWTEAELHEFGIRAVKGFLKLWRVHMASQSGRTQQN